MAMRLNGLMSGMDTESIVAQMVQAKKLKVDNAVKAQKKLEWKRDAWKTLNSKVIKLFDGALGNMRFESSFIKKTTKVSNSNVVSVITGEGAMNSVQTLKVSQLAKSAYLTGGKLGAAYTKDTTMGQLGFEGESGRISVNVDGQRKEISIDSNTTVDQFVQQLKDAGVDNASFDAQKQQFVLDAGNKSFSVSGMDISGVTMLSKLGLDEAATPQSSPLKGTALPSKHYTGDTNLWTLGIDGDRTIKVKVGGEEKEIKVNSATTIQGLVTQLNDAGVTASFDAANQRFYIASKESGTDNDFSIEGADEASNALLATLGLTQESGAVKDEAVDAKITLNGVEYESSKNTFEINGLTLTVNAVTAENETVTITTQDDTDGIYDMIKNFLKEYNELINEMDKLYNADSAKGYEPLTNEEKASMNDADVEEWDKKVKDALLRKDDTLGGLASAMKEIMLSGVTMSNGSKMYLSNFGIETLNYFTAPENEKNAYHIDGDSDDSNTSGNADKLRSMIANDPDTVVEFFSSLSKNLYSKMQDMMAPTEYSSAFTVYEDKKMKEEYDGYTSKIKDLEKKLADYEDKWYAKFAAMETAMAKLQKGASAVTSLLGG